MKNEIKIYVLVDPITIKIRYIGRTKCELKKRLREHVSKSKKKYDNTHKSNWIRTLLKVNKKPIIRLLTTINEWTESHQLERELISKYKDRLLNHDDRGEGCKNKIITKQQRKDISNGLKKYFSMNRDNLPYCKKIYVYNCDGSFLNEFPSIRNAARELKFPLTAIHKYFNSIHKIPYRKTWQFSYTKVELMHNYEQYINENCRLNWRQLGLLVGKNGEC